MTDVTARAEAEHFRSTMMDTMVEGLYALDDEGRVAFMNSAAERILGWTEDELRGKPMHDIVHFQHADGSPHPAEDCPLLQVRQLGRPTRRSHEAFTRKDGTICPVSYSAAPLRNGWKANGVVVVFSDTTEEQDEQERVRRELDTLAWVGRIRDAVDEDRLTLYSQPIVPLAGGKPSQELLLRMIGTNGEIIAPGSFLPVAEKYGMIAEIDRWVISQAARIAGSGQNVEANLSADSISDLSLLTFIEHELRDAGADPANLVFEITETALTTDIEAGTAFINGLTDIGCRVALDDFGTGFASLTHLKTFNLAYLKIDVDFVRNLAADTSNQHLVKAIASLAKDFGYETIAEGVEDAETLAILVDYGVDFAQGFHIGRPSPTTAPTQLSPAFIRSRRAAPGGPLSVPVEVERRRWALAVLRLPPGWRILAGCCVQLGRRLRLCGRLGLRVRLIAVSVERHRPLQALVSLGERQVLRDDLIERGLGHHIKLPASPDRPSSGARARMATCAASSSRCSRSGHDLRSRSSGSSATGSSTPSRTGGGRSSASSSSRGRP